MHESIYQPQEDSYLLLEQVRKFAKGSVLDMGTGSGILAFEAARKADFVVALDINHRAIEFVENLIIIKKLNKMLARDSNLFSFLRNNYVIYDKKKKAFNFRFYKNKNNRFDTIIFNPPYLPKHKGEEPDVDLYVSGGKYGYEILEDFIDQLSDFMSEQGQALVIFSSLTNKRKILETAMKNLLEFEQLAIKKVFMEELYCYRLKKTKLLKQLEKKGLSSIKMFAKGHRGWIFTAMYKGKKVAVKKQREDIAAKDTVKNEISFLKKLNKQGIGPKLLFTYNDSFVYEFIEGTFIRDFFRLETDKKKLKKVIEDTFKLMLKLDKLGINKEEMHHPNKHVIIDDKLESHLIDFERANNSKKPKNVTQFTQYITSSKDILESKGFKINIEKLRKAAQEYKQKPTIKNYKKILSLVH
ncbi:methyltransferase [Candidatus Woesearchaeota archaeon]|nr:methyltransferase [Candidatus Woesearchaeota archaeon]